MWGTTVRPRKQRLPAKHWTAGELALSLCVSRMTIHNWAKRGLLPFVQVGRHRRYPEAAVRAACQLAARVHSRTPRSPTPRVDTYTNRKHA